MNSQDKELIELAAKAVKLPECGWMGPAFMYVKDNTFTDWNPLKDSGDALQLVVNLHLIIGVYDSYTSVCLTNSADRLFTAEESLCWNSETNGDPCAATRKAITRAAAGNRKEYEMKQDAVVLWNSCDSISIDFCINWQEQGEFYSIDSDFDLFCTYLGMSV